jgi:parallel beta-helix repeat protein
MKTKSLTIISLVILLVSNPVIFAISSSDDQPLDTGPLFMPLNKDEAINILHFKEGNTSYTSPLCTLNQTFTISQEEIQFIRGKDKIQIALANASLLNQPGLPLIPMKTLSFTLPKDIVVHDVEVNVISAQKSIQSISFQNAPYPQFYSINETPLHQHTDEIIEQSLALAHEQKVYPSATHSYTIGKNSTATQVIVHLFPICYQFNTKQTYIIDKGTITIRYEPEQQASTQATSDSAENIIITPPKFYFQAKKLQQFHTEQGVETEVVTTTWIQSNYEPSEYPPVIGYSDFTSKELMRKYDDELACKIISYLQTQSTNPNLRFITILGNAIHVPPSYYFGYSYYPVPTDFYYSSPDLDLIPNYRIGRIPVDTTLEAIRTVNKIINWNPTGTQMDNVAIAGGIPFNSPFFIGELITIDSVNQGLLDGLNVDKYYRTNERFENTDILSALQNEYGLLFMICHGNANVIVAEDGRISARDLLNMPRNDNAPIFSCIACSSGSYDTHIIKQGHSYDKTSFGEGIVISKGGGIAYIGGSRTNDGYPLLALNNGRVEVTKETYMAGLLTYVNQAYGNNVDHLGDLTFSAYETYLENNDLTDFWNQYHYFDFILLGDPALQLPDRSFQQPSYEHPISNAKDAVRTMSYVSSFYEYNGTICLQAIDEEITYESHSDSPFINLKQIETGNNDNMAIDLSTHPTQNNKALIDITSDAGGLYLLRFETKDGKEDWSYYQTARPVDDDFDSTTKGFGSTRWDSIQEAIDNAHEYDPIFVFDGIYNESISIDKPCSLEGETRSSTIIDGDGNDDVLYITSEGVMVKGFTIQHCGKNPWNAGVSIQPKRSLNQASIIIKDNNIINNKNCGIYIETGLQLLSPSISILQNAIMYNNYGVYIQQGPESKEFVSNTIQGNNYGFYLVGSSHDLIAANTIENNYVGLFLQDVKKSEIDSNNFIENTQHCQFTETRSTTFSYNFWDNWFGLRFKINLPIPKLINGFHDSSVPLRDQFKLDLHPVKEPYIINA